MIGVVTAQERDKYVEIWSDADYAKWSPGLDALDYFWQISGADALTSARVIDIGCGQGKAGQAFAERGWDVTLLDLVRDQLVDSSLPFYQTCLWHEWPTGAQRWDFGYCADVMEHVPTEFTMLAVDQMLRHCRHVFFQIALVPDHFGSKIGQPLHLTVQDYVWWRDRLGEIGRLVEARDCLKHGVYYVQSQWGAHA